MNFLLDTHILIWAAGDNDALPIAIRSIIENPENELFFSPASIWEIAIKHGRERKDFHVDPYRLQHRLIDSGNVELPITSRHAIAIAALPLIHKDPFDRILIAQAIFEDVPLVTVDKTVLLYPGLQKH